MRQDSFAINDTELGDIDLVEHAIDTGNVKPFPRRLPYALRKELEEELSTLGQRMYRNIHWFLHVRASIYLLGRKIAQKSIH